MCKLLTQTYLIISSMGIMVNVIAQVNMSAKKISSATFNEGIVYSKTSFPGHPVNNSYQKVDFESGDFSDQNNVIQELKKHQKSIPGKTEQEIKDVFFISAMMFLPAYTKMYFSPAKTLVEKYALGYSEQTLINTAENSGKIILCDRDKTNQGTIKFSTQDIKEVWQKYQINAEQYSIQKTTETAVIAGYPCKKIIYTFGGTSRGQPVGNYVINVLPLKVTAWYSDELPPSINLIHPLYFEMDKAVLKFEVEYDKNKKNKMVIEVTKLKPLKIEEEKFDIADKVPVVVHKKNTYDAGMMVMQVIMSAIGLLTK